MYICILEDRITERAWITNVQRIELRLDWIFLKHPYISAAIILIILGTVLLSIMFKVYLWEIKSVALDMYAKAYINHVEKPKNTKIVLTKHEKFVDEKRKLFESIRKSLMQSN